MDLDAIWGELRASEPYFKVWNPQWSSLFRFYRSEMATRGIKFTWRTYKAWKRGEPLPEAIGEALGSILMKQVFMRQPRRIVTRGYHVIQEAPPKDWSRKNGLGGRSHIMRTGAYPLVIVFHDANRAGPHIDVHMGRFSLVYRVKPDLYSKLRYNRSGQLTEASRKAILDHVRSEIANGSRVPQNLDHTRSNGTASWYGGDPTATHYGAGRTRQVVLASKVHVYKAHVVLGPDVAPVEMYAPDLNPHRPLYLHRLYSGGNGRVPIYVWGTKRHHPPVLQERLHLKLIHPEDLDSQKHQDRIDSLATTAKYDGSSAYIVITPKGTTVWSPRTAKSTGMQIEYTHKLREFAGTTYQETIIAMGEVMLRTRTRWPWQRSEYVPQTVAAGHLVSHDVIPKDLVPEIRLYRVDRIGRKSMIDLPFWENRALQEMVSSLSPRLHVVKLSSPQKAASEGFEGVVTIPAGGNVLEGFKTKWWQDADDWVMMQSELHDGPSGKPAGVVWFRSMTSGKAFKLGPGQLGDEAFVRSIMDEPKLYEGTVFQVRSRHGHEGRAAKVLLAHMDKGTAPQ
jgi:hypothetical protein